MTDTPPYAELLSLIDDRSAALRDAVAAAADLGARVPGGSRHSFPVAV
jgi:hypothetical protein